MRTYASRHTIARASTRGAAHPMPPRIDQDDARDAEVTQVWVRPASRTRLGRGTETQAGSAWFSGGGRGVGCSIAGEIVLLDCLLPQTQGG